MVHYISKGNFNQLDTNHIYCHVTEKIKRLGWIQLGLLNENAGYGETVTILFFQDKAKINQEKKKVTLVT